jgi:hypothetical protein
MIDAPESPGAHPNTSIDRVIWGYFAKLKVVQACEFMSSCPTGELSAG